jgi:hypothetical protein
MGTVTLDRRRINRCGRTLTGGTLDLTRRSCGYAQLYTPLLCMPREGGFPSR